MADTVKEVSKATEKAVEAPVDIHNDAVVTVPVASTDEKVVVHVPTVHDLPHGTVIAPGITVA